MGKRAQTKRAMRHPARVEEVPDRDAVQVIESHDCEALDRLREFVQHREVIEFKIRDAIEHVRGEHGVSWAEIGDVLGMTRQGARQRYGEARGATGAGSHRMPL